MTEGAVYERIKNWLLAQTLVPGQLLQIGVLADELGVSTTPVREALTRLAAERMIMSVPKRGFFARTPSEDDILGLYSVNQTILDAAVARWPEQSGQPPAVAPEATDEVPVQERSAEQLARQTGELFLQIATRSGVGEFAEIIRNMNDRLHHARVLESEIVADAFVEVGRIAALAAATRPCAAAPGAQGLPRRAPAAGRRHLQRAAAAAVHDGRLVTSRVLRCSAARPPRGRAQGADPGVVARSRSDGSQIYSASAGR